MEVFNEADVLQLLGSGDVSDVGSFTDDDFNIDVNLPDALEKLINRVSDETDNSSYFEVDQCTFLPPERKIQWLRKPFKQPVLHLNKLDESVYIDTLKSPVGYFSEYFGCETFEKMTYFTNIYATQNNLGSTFKLTDANEMRIFVAIQIIMGTFHGMDMRMYWEKSIFGNAATDLIAQNMTRERFYFLRNNFHVIDNSNIPVDNKDKFIKVRPLFNQFLQKCRSLPVERNIGINEQMIPFKQLAMRTYVAGKPHKWSVKMFLLCGESGFIYNSLLFQGNFDFSREIVKDYGFGGSIVLHLTENLKPNRHFLFFQDYFTSFGLLETLYHKGIYATGSVGIKQLTKAPLLSDKCMRKKGVGTTFEITTELPNNCNLSLVKWLDKDNFMHLASNYVASGNIEYIYRWHYGPHVDYERPQIVKDYTKVIKCFNSMNEMVNSCQKFIRSPKWVLRVAMHIFDLAVFNSWTEYKKHADILQVPTEKLMRLMIFRLKLALTLISMSKSKPVPTSKKLEVLPPDSVRFDGKDHIPELDNILNATRCKLPTCENKRTHIYCSKCNVHLCGYVKRNCFETFHTKS